MNTLQIGGTVVPLNNNNILTSIAERNVRVLFVGEGNFTFTVAYAALRQSLQNFQSLYSGLLNEGVNVQQYGDVFQLLQSCISQQNVVPQLFQCLQQVFWGNIVSTCLSSFSKPISEGFSEVVGNCIASATQNIKILTSNPLHLPSPDIIQLLKHIPMPPDGCWISNIDACNSDLLPISSPSLVWFQCPWVSRSVSNGTATLIKNFLIYTGQKISPGTYVCIGIALHPDYVQDYQLESTRTTAGMMYKFCGADNEFIYRLLEYGYHHQGIMDIHDKILRNHVTLIFERKQDHAPMDVCRVCLSETPALATIPNVRVVYRIHKRAREWCTSELTAILEHVVKCNSVESWNRLFLFAPRCLKRSQRVERTESPASDPMLELVITKIKEGNIRSAIQLASSDDMLADFDGNAYALRTKHPSPYFCSHIPPPDVISIPEVFEISKDDIVRAIKSFPSGSDGGPDRLRPQHLKDLVCNSQWVNSDRLLSALVDFCHLVLRGDSPEMVKPLFFGASMVAFRKKSGEVYSTAVGCTLRRLVAKVACNVVVTDMAQLLAPHQLGYGIRNGAESVVHAARFYLYKMSSEEAMVKLDFANAFNSIRRDCMLRAVHSLCPEIYTFVYSAYAASSILEWDNWSILSAEGIQQGDPMGPLLFCLTLHKYSQFLRSEFSVLYLDHVTLGGDFEDLIHDLELLEDAVKLGLTLNTEKCEIISHDTTMCGTLLTSLPDAQLVPPSHAQLLGSPLGDVSISAVLNDRVEALIRLGKRLEFLSARHALILLCNCFTQIPMLLYILRSAPCYCSSTLEIVDDFLQAFDISAHLKPNSSAQAILLKNLKICSAVKIAPSAFLASVRSSFKMVNAILPPRLRSLPNPFVDECLALMHTQE